MIKDRTTGTNPENAVLVGLITPEQRESQSREYLDELEFLAETAKIRTVRRFIQRLEAPNSLTFVGSGKLQEIRDFVEDADNGIDIVIFDDELTPRQLHNIEAGLKVKIMDRTSLILNIFAVRARTAHAKTQVELAEYNYMLPRLKSMWTHLERQSGGGGGGFRMRGPGETQLETDRRIVLGKISKLKSEIMEIDRQKSIQRQNRGRLVRVALVGYTNAGKSTLMRLMTGSEVFVEDKLFATLDTTVRKTTIDNLAFLLTDTVGFIRKLPAELIESFKSTLDEVREADLLVHVVDVSHPSFEERIEVVDRTLEGLTGGSKPVITVFNKIDIFSYVNKEADDLTPLTRENISLDDLRRTWVSKSHNNCVFISAVGRQNIDEFRAVLYDRVRSIHVNRFPYNDFLFHHFD
ncbi:MAG: GTPase HflX [Dysgonamonadaceae bacterium]|jgi:GTP-binding protein HflX|nr:GTPase HflX [Dysgonamonadaceae bacterium]